MRHSAIFLTLIYLLASDSTLVSTLAFAEDSATHQMTPDEYSRMVTDEATDWARGVLAQARQLVSIGRNIFIMNHVEAHYGSRKASESFRTLKEASSQRFSTSTDYFSFMVTSDFTNVEFRFFSAPGVLGERSRDENRFGAENNAWCVVSDVSTLQSTNSPIYFTRNVHIDRLGVDIGVNDIHGLPFGTNCAVVITKYGDGLILEGEREIKSYFSSVVDTNIVLRP